MPVNKHDLSERLDLSDLFINTRWQIPIPFLVTDIERKVTDTILLHRKTAIGNRSRSRTSTISIVFRDPTFGLQRLSIQLPHLASPW
jgi:hypothetical protein